MTHQSCSISDFGEILRLVQWKTVGNFDCLRCLFRIYQSRTAVYRDSRDHFNLPAGGVTMTMEFVIPVLALTRLIRIKSVHG